MDNADLPTPPDASKVSAEAREVSPGLGLGRWAPFQYERSADATAVRLFWGRIMVWLLVLGGIGWVSLASGAYAFVKYRRGFSEVSYGHMLLLPWKLEDYRRAKGEFLIRQGLELAERQEWRAAFGLLRSGLPAVPEHREARLMVARIYLMAGRADMTRSTLADGLRHHGDEVEYLRQVLGFFFGLQADDTVIGLTDELRGRLEAGSAAWRMANTARAYAFFNRDRHAEAVAVLEEAKLLGTPEGRFVLARIDWEEGRRDAATTRLRELTAQVPEDFEIYRTLVHYLREQKRWGEVRTAAVARQLALPERVEAYVDFIAACGDEGDDVRREEAERAFLTRFAGEAEALLKLGEEAARAGRVEVAKAVEGRCRELGRGEADAGLLVVTALLARGDAAGAVGWSDELVKGAGAGGGGGEAWTERARLVLGGLRAVAFYATGREAEAEPLVRRVCDTRVLPATVLLALAERLEGAGRRVEAQRVLSHAVEVDPLNQATLAMLMRGMLADGKTEEALERVERLLGMRKPPAELLARLARTLESDLYLFLPGRERGLGMMTEWLAERGRRG